MYKKAQAQDIFADLIPAIVIILLICLPTLAIMNYSHKQNIENEILGLSSEFLTTNALIMLKMPMPGKSTDFATMLFMLDVDADMSWASDLITSYPYECTETLKLYLAKHFIDYSSWSVMVSTSDTSDIIFFCESDQFNSEYQTELFLPSKEGTYDLVVDVEVKE